MQQFSDKVYWHFSELTSRIVAESGIPTDKEHLGKILLRSFKDAPDFILQIDGGTGEEETNKSVLERTVLCASSFRNFGLNYQDVIVVIAPNHLHISIPLYAAACIGAIFAGIDTALQENELADTFKYCKPKMVLCQSSKSETVRKALARINASAQIITFDKGSECTNFSEFIQKYSADSSVASFKVSDFDPENTNAILVSTSGSTGLPKLAALTHRNICIGFISNGISFSKLPTPFNISLVTSPIQWISAVFQMIMSPIMRYTRLTTSTPLTQDHVFNLINKYRPEYAALSPAYLMTLLKGDQRHKCDFTSFKYMLIIGSFTQKELLEDLKNVCPSVVTNVGYGMTEASAVIFNSFDVPLGSIGRPKGLVEIKLVNPTTEECIIEPNQPGELRLKGPSIFKGYYNNLEMTAAAFDKDGWLKTGDILYRDEHFNFYFVDRLKTLLKYRNHQVSPVELESVILKHPGVLNVAVTGIPDVECGDLPVAFVMKNEDHDVSSQDIMDLVKESLTDSKQLRGGVVFLNALPLTSTFKGYYNNLEMTAAAFDKDGWLKTGDILYRDEHFNFYFVDRLKTLLKYRNHQVSPVELESVILKHPGVLNVAVTGIPDVECGDLPVAFVMKSEDHDVSSQDIMDLVKESLTDSKQLRGGVVFLNALPLTSTFKVDRAKLKKMAINLKKDIKT